MTAKTELVRTSKSASGTLNVYEGTGEVIRVRVIESHHHKTPSCYMGKVFELTHTGHCESIKNDGTVTTWESYTGKFKNGKELHFTHYSNHGWNVSKNGCFASNWIKVEPAE